MPPKKATPRPNRQYATIEDAANMLACSTDTVRRMISRGEITGFRVSKRMLRVDLAEIESIIEVVPAA